MNDQRSASSQLHYEPERQTASRRGCVSLTHHGWRPPHVRRLSPLRLRLGCQLRRRVAHRCDHFPDATGRVDIQHVDMQA